MAPATQEFTVRGATFSEVAFPKYDGPLTASTDQLRIRYDASANRYEILEPKAADWRAISANPQDTPIGLAWRTTDTGRLIGLQIMGDSGNNYPANLYSYSALVGWGHGADGEGLDSRGGVAFGIASSPSAIPTSGSAVFNGSIAGDTTETWDWDSYGWGHGVGNISGSIKLSFDFGNGSLSGSISPMVYVNDQYDLPTMNFVDTVYATGSTTFSGRFATSLTGGNSFSGLFTGPQASELIGDFMFPYTSPEDGKVYEAGGGFIAKKN